MTPDPEPIDTSTPWHRPRRELMSQVEYERQAYDHMARRGDGRVGQYSVMTNEYEPNRPMAPDPDSIISKKGLRPKKANTYKEVDIWDKVVGITVIVCLAGIIGITIALSIKLG